MHRIGKANTVVVNLSQQVQVIFIQGLIKLNKIINKRISLSRRLVCHLVIAPDPIYWAAAFSIRLVRLTPFALAALCSTIALG